LIAYGTVISSMFQFGKSQISTELMTFRQQWHISTSGLTLMKFWIIGKERRGELLKWCGS